MERSPKQLSDKMKKGIAVSGVLLFLVVCGVVVWFVGKPMLEYAAEPEKFRRWIDARGVWGPGVFLGMMVLQTFVAIIPGEPLELVAGYAFGTWQGTVLCIAGQTIGSILIFLFVRKFGVKAVEIFYPIEKLRSLRFLQKSRKRDFLCFLIFLIPGTPKDMISYFVGLTDMKLSTWLWISLVARIPAVITSTIGGDAFGMQNYTFAIIVLACTLIISICGILLYRKICKIHEERAGKQTPEEDD